MKDGRCMENSGKEQSKEVLMWSRSNPQQPQSIFWAKQLSIKSVRGTQIIFAVVNSSHPLKLKALLTRIAFLQFFKGSENENGAKPSLLWLSIESLVYGEWLLNINNIVCKRNISENFILGHWNTTIPSSKDFSFGYVEQKCGNN